MVDLILNAAAVAACPISDPGRQARCLTQRHALEMAAHLISDLPGPALDIGHGTAHAYLSELMPCRRILSFGRDADTDAEVHARGEAPALKQLRIFRSRVADRPRAALAHVDCGPLDLTDAVRAGGLAAQIDALMRPGGIVVSDWPMRAERWRQFPFEVPSFPYFIYRVSHD